MRLDLAARCNQRTALARTGNLLLVALTLAVALAASPAHAQATLTQNQGPNLTNLVGIVEQQLSASGGGGNGTYVWSVVSGSLPPGIALRTDVPSFFPASANAGLIGLATTTGTFTFTLRVSSGGQTNDRAYTWKITNLTLIDIQLPDAFAGQSYSYRFTALNNVGPVTFSANGALPSGMALSSDGVLSGIPPAAGFFNVNLRITDSIDSTTHSRSFPVFAIRVSGAPEIAPGVLSNATQGVPYATTVTASGGAGGYTFTACPGNSTGVQCAPGSVALPSGLELDASGVIAGTTTAFPGRYGFVVTATDSAHVSYSRVMSIDVIGTPPTLPSISPYSGLFEDCGFGVGCARGVFVINGGEAPFTWTAVGLPPGMAIRTGGGITQSFVTPGDAEIFGRPMALGTFNVQTTVTDARGASATNTFTLHVSPMWMQDRLVNGTIGVPYSRKLRIVGGTLPYTGVLTGGSLPAGLTFNPATLTVSGTPIENSQFNFSFDPLFRFTDAAGNTLQDHSYFGIAADASSTIAINTGSNLGTRTLNAFTSIQFSACCLPSFTWSVIGGAIPTGMSLSASGVLSGTPTVEGTYTFLAQVADPTNAANVAARQFTLTITSLSPTTVSFTLPYGNVGTPYSTPLAGIGVTGLTWTVTPNTYPPPGLSVDAATGVLQGTPQATGQFSVSVDIRDGAGRMVTRSFSISIYPAGVNPPLNLNIGTAFGPFLRNILNIQLVGAGGKPPYHFSLTPGATNVPGMRVQDGQPLPTNFTTPGGYIGVIAESGVYQTSLRITDSLGAHFDRAITITVSPLAITSQVSPPRPTVNVPYAFDIVPYGGSGNYSFAVSSGSTMPPGLALDALGHISGTPTIAGPFSFSVTLTDLNTSDTLSLTHTLNINPFGILNGGILPQGVTGTPYTPITFSAPGCGAGCSWSLIGTLPAGLNLTSGGVLSGTPSAVTNTSFTIQATGSAGTVQKVFALQVVSNLIQALTILTTSVGPNAIGGLPTVGLFAQGGTPPYNWSLQSGTLPPGITMQSPGENVGALTVPGFTYLAGRAVTAGLYTFTLAVTDSHGVTATRTLTWNISRLSFQYTSLPIVGTAQINTPLVHDTPYTQPLLVTGGTGTYTFQNNAPMPPGLSLDSATGIVSGTPSNTGTFSIPIQATDGDGNTNVSNISFAVAGPTATVLGFTAGPGLGNLQQGLSFRFNITPTGGTAPYTVTALTAMPPGFALESGDALLGTDAAGSVILAGVPPAPGNYSVTLLARDAAATSNIGVRTFTFTVVPFTLFSSQTLADGSVGVPYSHAIRTLNGGATTWAVSATSGLPPGLNVSSGGVISGTPTTPGSYSFVLNAIDATFGTTNALTFTVRISQVAIADPTVLPQVAVAGSSFSYPFTGSGAATIVWSAVGLPDGLTMTPAGTITGTPESSGTFNVVVTATDGIVPISRRVTLFVRLPNAAQLDFPLVNTTLPDVTIGQTVGLNTSFTSGGTPPYQWSVAPGSTLPPGLQLVVADINLSTIVQGATVLTGAPTTAGQYTFDLIVSDSATPANSVRRTFTLNVTPLNILSGAPRNATMGAVYSQRFTTVGGTGPYTYTIEPTSLTQEILPPGLAMSIDGVIAGTPTSTGTYSFRVRARDTAGRTFARATSLVVNSASGLRVTSTNPSDTWVGASDRSLFLSTSGNATYSWSLVSGPLPPGIALMTDGPDTFLAGSPTTAGVYIFTLRATNTAASTNTADHTFTWRISPMQIVAPSGDLSTRALPAGEVGAAYSFTFKVAGGAPPYTITASPFTPLPPGLSFSGTTLNGTPQAAGNFNIQPIVSDAAGRVVNAFAVTLTVTPAGRVAPLVRGDSGTEFIPDGSVGVPYIMPLVELPFLFSGGRAPFSWTLAPGQALPPGLALLAGGNGLSNMIGGVPTTAGGYGFSLILADASGQTVTVPFALNISTLSLTPAPPLSLPSGMVGVPYAASLVPSGGIAPYTIQLDPSSGNVPGVSLSPSGLLAGTPTAPGMFLLFGFVSDATGNAFTFVHFVNVDNAAGEAPALKVAPKPLQVFYTTGSPAPAPIPVAVMASTGSLPFNALLTGIPAATLSSSTGTASTVINLNLNVAGLAAGTYRGVVAFKAPDAVNLFDATPITVTVVAPPPCTYSVNPPTATMPATGGAGSFTVTAGPGCAWSATGPPPSVAPIVSGATGTGNGTVSYTVVPNTGTSARTLNFGVLGQTHAVTQFGSACSFAISPSKLTVSAAGGTAGIAVTPSLASCTWTATGLGATPASGTGSGVVTITIPPNPGLSTVTMSATIAGKTLNVTQAGVACTVGLSPYNASAPAAGGPGSIAIATTTGCAYDTTSLPSWVHVTSGGSGTTSGTLLYSVDPNSTTVSRVGTMTVGGQPFQVTQDALACTLTIDTTPLGSPYGSAGGVGTVGIIANGANCSWSASSNASWIAVAPQSSSGNGSVGITVQSNGASTTGRSAALTIAGQTINVSQAGTACTYALQSANGTVPAAGAAGSVGVIAPSVCGWTATVTDPIATPWLTISSAGTSGSADVNFVAQPNTSSSPRAGTLTVAGLPYTVTQAAAPCAYTLTPGNVTVAAEGAVGTFAAAAVTGGCSPTAVSYASWIAVAMPAPGTVRYTVAANPTTVTRTGTIRVGEQNFTITQNGGACGFSLNSYSALFGPAGDTTFGRTVFGSPSALGCTPNFGTNQPGFITLGTLSGPTSNIFTLPYAIAPFGSLTPALRFGNITFGGQIFIVKQTSY